MKRAVVLHGYRGNPYVNWYPWLAWKLRQKGYETWAPRLPMSTFPNGKTWTHKLLGRSDWSFDSSTVIGHSAGAVEILNLLSNLPNGQKIKTAVLVSVFKPRPQWPRLNKLIPEPLDFEKIQANCDKFIFVIAADDPHVPVSDPKYFKDKLGGELIILPSGGHFSILRNIRYWRFPELLNILEEKKLL